MRNFHDDQMNSPRSSARLARWSARQATSMPNLTSLMAWSFRWWLISRLSVVDRCTFRRGVTIQTFEKQGSDSMIGRRVPEKGCTCVGRLVWSTITVDGVELSLAPTPRKVKPEEPTRRTLRRASAKSVDARNQR